MKGILKSRETYICRHQKQEYYFRLFAAFGGGEERPAYDSSFMDRRFSISAKGRPEAGA
jgi:hypothetical protein